MVIFHSYVKLPEGSFSQELCFLSFALETLSILCYDIYIYMICYVILSDFMTFLESLFCCRLNSTFQSQKRGHLMQLTWCCLPGRGTAREMGLQLGLKWTTLQYGNTGSLLMGDVMHMSIIIIHYYYCLRPHYYSLLWLFMSMFILVYHCLSSLWRLSPYYYVYSSMTVWPHYDHYYHIIYGCRKQLYQEPVNEVEGLTQRLWGLWGWLSWWNSHGSCHHQLSYFTTLWIRLSNHRISIDTCTVNRQKSRVTVLLHLQNDSAFKHSSQTAPVVPTVLHCNQRAAKPMSPCLVPNVRCDATRSCMATTQN